MAAKLPAIFTDADKARTYLEEQRWPHGPICPHCGNSDQTAITALKGKAHRPGVYQCNVCREQFTVTVGTVFERSKIPLNTWLYATSLLCSSKKGISSHQLHRMLGVTYKTAWFMTHRIREAMKEADPAPMGGDGKSVEVDETYFGKRENPRTKTTRGRPFTKSGKTGPANKRAVIALVELCQLCRADRSRLAISSHTDVAIAPAAMVATPAIPSGSTLVISPSRTTTTPIASATTATTKAPAVSPE